MDVGDPLFQEVPEPRGTVLEEVVGVLLVGELREDDDADVRVGGADLLGGPDAFVGPRRRHPDVGQDGVRCVLLDGREELVERCGGPDDVDVARVGEERDRPLPDQVVILREDDAQHARIVHGGLAAA